MSPKTTCLIVLVSLAFVRVSLAIAPAELPVAAPDDAIMAKPREISAMASWVEDVFTRGAQPSEAAATQLLAPAGPPFSFEYGGKHSAELLPAWQYLGQSEELADRTRRRFAWTDPTTGLRVAVEVIVYKRYPAVDWMLRFENLGGQDTPILENIRALDVLLATNELAAEGVLHQIAGDDFSQRSFTPQDIPLPVNGKIELAPFGGRSSQGAFPFFNFEYQQQGLFVAIGWSGQWAASFRRDSSGQTRLQAGMERTHLRLHPGESIRSPRILLMGWHGDRLAGHNRFRRLMLFHYTPQQASRPPVIPIFWQGYDRYRDHPTWPTEAGQRHAAAVARQVGCDALWLDAAWFKGGFPNGVGNWFCDPRSFPNGLKPVGMECHNLGLKFILWFEPERVAPDTQIAREHPEFVFGGSAGGMFKLNDPNARRYLTDILLKQIEEAECDWYRTDYNLDPLWYWRGNDAADRQGMTEIRYLEGLYAMWDELLQRRPGLVSDNCASGGRRIDLETNLRSLPLWRSDTACVPGHAEWHHAQAVGMNYFLPLHETCAWTPAAYVMRSAAGAGAIVQFAFLDKDFPTETARQAVAEVRENQKYFYGDFYPLAGRALGADQFLAYQMHRADLDAGIVLAFRRAKCDTPQVSAALHGLNAETEYHLELIDEQRRKTEINVAGRSLMTKFPLEIPQPASSLLVRYRPNK